MTDSIDPGSHDPDLSPNDEGSEGMRAAATDSPIQQFTESMISLRQLSGYSQENAAIATRISVSFVRALEEGRLDELPGRVFVVGFIKNLCKTYGQDAEEPLRLLERCDWDQKHSAANLAPAVSRQNYQKTSNVVRLQKNSSKPSIYKQIHWRTFSKTMVLYLIVPIIGVATILLSLKTIQIETVVSWADDTKASLMAAFSEVTEDIPTEAPKVRLPLEIAASQNEANPQGEASPATTAAPESKDVFDPAKLTPDPAASTAASVSAAEAQAGAQQASAPAEAELGSRAKATATARVPATAAPVSQRLKQEQVQEQEQNQEQELAQDQELMTASLQKVGTPAKAMKPTARQSVITLQVLKPVKVRFKTGDKKKSKTVTLTPDIYQYPFATSLETLIFDASRVKISFNGKNLGNIGSKGRVRKLTFHHKKTSADR